MRPADRFWGGASDEPGLDPREAATLLEQTTRRAQRQFEIRTPLLMVIGAATVLVAYGAVWLSVRNQHPYSGPSGTALAVLYSTLIARGVVVAMFNRRARSGVSGRSSRQRGSRAPCSRRSGPPCTCSKGRCTRRRQPCHRLRHLPGGGAADHRRLSRCSPLGRARELARSSPVLTPEKTGNGAASRTAVALTNDGRAALDAYTEALRALLGGL